MDNTWMDDQIIRMWCDSANTCDIAEQLRAQGFGIEEHDIAARVPRLMTRIKERKASTRKVLAIVEKSAGVKSVKFMA
jgi:hypothetical protein